MNVQYKINNIYIFVTLAKTTAYHTKRKIKWVNNDEDENDSNDINDLPLLYAADVLH